MTTALTLMTSKLATRFGLEAAASDEMLTTLKATAFKSKDPVTDQQMLALLMVAEQYGLNPWTKEIYAYPDDRRGIVPVVGVDGWARIINEHPAFDGLEFEEDVEAGAMTCRIYRKDRSRPTAITEFFDECKRGTDPWKNMPRRMLRHKAMMQCARIAFGFALMDDEDAQVTAGLVVDNETGEISAPKPRGPQRRSATPAPSPVEVVEAAPSASPPEPETRRAPPPPAQAPAAAGTITAGQVAYLRNKLSAAGMDEPTICDRYSVGGIELLTPAQFDELKAELLRVL